MSLSASYYRDKPCRRCGVMMMHVFHNTLYCPTCRKKIDSEAHQESEKRRRIRRKSEPKPLPTGESLDDVVARAKAAGRSYGWQVWFELWQKELMRRGKIES